MKDGRSFDGRSFGHPSRKPKGLGLHLAAGEGSFVFVTLLIVSWAISLGITLGRDA